MIGGDGFCGWPTVLELSAAGHEILILDNLSRRKIDLDLDAESLTPIESLSNRILAWKELTGKFIDFQWIDVASEFEKLSKVFKEFAPDAVVHFGEQRAAPYSMLGSKESAYTMRNNVFGTHNVLMAIQNCAIDAHLVHLGTMGVYGYNSTGLQLPDGYIRAKMTDDFGNEIVEDILYPTNPGSIYHLTKSIDALTFQFYCKNYNLKITDLHQGIVWGTQTEHTALGEQLVNRFDYDGEYGTVLNRFLVQGTIGEPLTVYGTGRQTRAFIHITDTVKCVRLAIESGVGITFDRVRIMNQVAETHRLIDLAYKVSEITGTDIALVDNPRKELPENTLTVGKSRLEELGFRPTTMDESLLDEVITITQKYKARIKKDSIVSKARW